MREIYKERADYYLCNRNGTPTTHRLWECDCEVCGGVSDIAYRCIDPYDEGRTVVFCRPCVEKMMAYLGLSW